eukprot:4745540-Karenia_brevis.AAC.1
MPRSPTRWLLHAQCMCLDLWTCTTQFYDLHSMLVVSPTSQVSQSLNPAWVCSYYAWEPTK